ncbi:MAG: Crp/Fnr family transcriptional regulator [Actinomycetota bacterium]|nr:Crp/Fnr family transcriptional regulator [Actinomycetota bacterium]
MAHIDILRQLDLLSPLGDEDLHKMAAVTETLQLERNDVLFVEDDDATALYVVISGRIAIARESIDGRESVLALMESGDLFGEMPLFDKRPRSADARALEASEVLFVPYDSMAGLYERRPELLWRVVALLANRLRAMDDALADAMFLDVPGRTAKRLLDLSGGSDKFDLPITQEELAGMVGASRERVNKALSSFARLGWIEAAEGRYTIIKRDALTLRSS